MKTAIRRSVWTALTLVAVCSLTIGLVSAAVPAAAKSQMDLDTDAIIESVTMVTVSATELSKKRDLGFRNEFYSVMGAFMKPGTSNSMTITLKKNKIYVFIAGGDSNTKDLDINVCDMNGKEIAKDNETDASPVVAFSPPTDGRYKVKLELCKGTGSSFCTLALLEENGSPLSTAALEEAMVQFIRVALVTESEVSSEIGMTRTPNVWSLMGTIIGKGESRSIGDVKLGGGARAFMAVGNDDAQDIDMTLHDAKNEKIAGDTSSSSIALFAHETKTGENYGLKTTLVSANDQCLLLSAVLDVK